MFGPAGLAVTLVEEFPKLVEKGRHRVEGQVHTARLVGQFAVPDGSPPARAVARHASAHADGRPAPSARRDGRADEHDAGATRRRRRRATARHGAEPPPPRRHRRAGRSPRPAARAERRRRGVRRSGWERRAQRQRRRRRRWPSPATTACRRRRWCSGSRGCRPPSSKRCAPTRPRTGSGAPSSTGSSSCSPAGTTRRRSGHGSGSRRPVEGTRPARREDGDRCGELCRQALDELQRGAGRAPVRAPRDRA